MPSWSGCSSNFTILDTDDQLRLLKQLIIAANLDEKRWPARQLAGLIDRWKNRGLDPGAARRRRKRSLSPTAAAQEFYAAYQERLKTLNACDFGDLLLHMLIIFKRPPRRARSTIASASTTSSSTNIRTPTPASMTGCACSPSRAATSAASATTTSRSIRGAAPRSPTSCASRRIFPARRSSGSSRITARPRTSSAPPPA